MRCGRWVKDLHASLAMKQASRLGVLTIGVSGPSLFFLGRGPARRPTLDLLLFELMVVW